MKKILLTAIAAVTLATTASAWQIDKLQLVRKYNFLEQLRQPRLLLRLMHKLWLNRHLLQLLNEANTLDFHKINICFNAVSRKAQRSLPPLPCGFSGHSIFR